MIIPPPVNLQPGAGVSAAAGEEVFVVDVALIVVVFAEVGVEDRRFAIGVNKGDRNLF